MTLHFMRVVTHTRMWAFTKLSALLTVWKEAGEGCGNDENWCLFCELALKDIQSHLTAIDEQTRMTFDLGIFGYQWLSGTGYY
ncbi:hypothetical protein C8A05DRAFT_39162 [Staphylotrichum tortipilum]|uniref:Uncharacterized protein n=1 Tax=Staphylotrichum tortipilum TaxID=2831512 RepID=A0AAN6RPD8_9PEZI|nr:hypothetical protein C8A05DRAFT_39162 [Staphylotrichum longicolle]